MNVTDQLQEISILFTYNGFITVLKQVARPPVAEVEVNSIPGEQPAHKGRESCVPRTKKEMNVIGHERPCKTFGTGLDEKLREVMEESPPVGIVKEDVAAVYAAYHDVLQKVWEIKASCSWHKAKIATNGKLVNK
ncbi:MAG TPA: hypothetical protein VGJ93_16110 [Desulfuromonadaceae bacterium]